MAARPDAARRSSLPITTPKRPGLTTYDAKDPDTAYPPIEPLRPPEGAPNVLVVLLDDVGLRRVQRVRRAVRDADRRAAGRRRAEVQPLPHHRAVLADRAGAAHRPQPPLGRHGRHHRDRDVGARATARCGRTTCAPLAETLKLNGYSTAQFGKCHEVPVWETSPMGPFDSWPDAGGGFEYFYGFIGGETNQWYPALYEGTTPVEPEKTPGGGLPLHRGHDRQGDRLGAPAEGADARQAVLHVLRARRDARPAPRAAGVVGQVQGPVRRRAGTRCARRRSRARRSSA